MSISTSIHNRLNKISQRIDALIVKFYRPYFVFICLLAILGYALVLLFPVLAISAISNIYTILIESETIAWELLAIWFVVLILASLFSYRISQIKVTPLVGLTAVEEKLPEIFKLVQEYQDHFKRPVIHRIVITKRYELDIIKVPKFPLPVWSMNTLVIGLPVLLSHTPKQFECMVARRMGQFSKQSNPVTNWVYQLRSVWRQYSFAFSKCKHPDCYLLKWLYGVYASLYTSASIHAARKDELNADSSAMELFTHDDVCKMITADATYQWFLQEHYWPAIDKVAATKTKTPLTPYQNITNAIRTNFKEDKIKSFTDKVFQAEVKSKSPFPSLLQRLENVAHDAPLLVENTGDVAASKYLGDSQKSVVNLIDTLWLKDNMERQKQFKIR